MSKIAIYTAIFDNYDVLLNPEDVPEDVDFFCFTDQGINSEVWDEVRPNLDSSLSPKLKNCKIMMKAHKYLSEYEYSLYIDGNIHIKEDISEFLEKYQDSNFAVPAHINRNCVYDEGSAVLEHGKADPQKVHKQMKKYRNEGLPENYGLPATRIIFRKHNQEEVISVMEDWWKEIQKGPERDQLSFSYVAWKNDFNFTFMDENPILYSCSTFEVMPHRGSGIKGRFNDFYIPLRAYRNKSPLHKASYWFVNYSLGAGRILKSEGPIELLKRSRKHFLKST